MSPAIVHHLEIVWKLSQMIITVDLDTGAALWDAWQTKKAQNAQINVHYIPREAYFHACYVAD